MSFAVNISDTPVTLKQSQDHQIYNNNVDPKQGHNHAKFERSCFNGIRGKANVSFVLMRKCVNYLPCPNVKIKHSGIYIHDLLDIINDHTKFQLIWVRP